ncbi:hypothetical protein [Kitasatospora sp. GP82]|uniref:hypothetical protein n=1 Tax=Kitasatospora sp. GP82 TaxID=3035089 RepID=UPI002475F8E0|nr:hypothetical protein [Kitasatospora sp. GP82]MDH6130179.1 hypothetical protein [Kitasatospora sp. GP82]
MPGTERVYITAGAPWHGGAERYSTLKDAVAAWLNTPATRWTTAVGSGRDKLAGHFVHQCQPVGRYAPATAPDSGTTEICSTGEWFDADGREQTKALMSCSHWNARVTVPQGWNHVGLLPAPSPVTAPGSAPPSREPPSPPGRAARRSTSPCPTT